MKTLTMVVLMVVAAVSSTGCALEVHEASPSASDNEVSEDCQRIALDGSGYRVAEDDETAIRTVEICGPDNDDVWMICRTDTDDEDGK